MLCYSQINARLNPDVQTENSQITNSIEPCQPARTAQADKSRYFLQMH